MEGRGARRGGIALRLALLALGAALPLTVGLVTIVLVSRDLARDDADRHVEATATATADSLAGYLQRIAGRLRAGTERRDVRAFSPSSCAGYGRGFVEALPQAVSLVLVGPAGTPVCSTTGGTAPLGDPAALRAVIRGAASAVGDPSFAGSTSPYATLDARVEGADGVGALVLALALDRLGTQLGASPPSTEGTLGAITAAGTLVARLPPPPTGTLGRTFPQYRNLDRRGRVAEAVGLDGVHRIFSAAPVAGTDWLAIASVARRDAYAIPDRILRIGLVFVGGALLVALGLTALLAGGLRRRIRAVSQAATRLGQLERGVRVPVTGPAEVAEVADSFNRMAASWEHARDELERLREIDAAMVTARSGEEAASRVARLLRQLTGVDRVAVHVVDAEAATVRIIAADGLGDDELSSGRDLPISVFGALVDRWREGAPIHLRGIDVAERPWAALVDPPVGSALHVPLTVDERLVGVVTLSCLHRAGLGPDAAAQAVEVAAHLTVVLDRALEASARERLMARLQTLLDIDRAILAAESPNEVAAVGLGAVVLNEPLVRASVAVYDRETRMAELLAVSGADSGPISRGTRFRLADGVDLDALARGETVELHDLESIAGNPFYEALVRAGIGGVVFVPLRERGTLIGALHLAAAKGETIPPGVIAIGREVADQIAIAIRQSLLLERERAARETIQEALAELAALHEVSDTSLARLPADELVGLLLPRVCSLMNADCARLLLADDAETILRVAASHGLDEVEAGIEMPFGSGVAGLVAEKREVMFFERDDMDNAYSPALRERVRALVGAPLLSGDDVLGVLDVGRYDDRPFADADRRLLTVAVDRLAAAVALARREERLEQAVAARTAELTTANDELDAFAYSVSHDLRAPLRAMRGFSTAILEDYGHALAAEGVDYARRIVGAVSRMEELIDDLLSYSRLSRSSLAAARVDLDETVLAVLAGLRGRPDVMRAEIGVAAGLGVVRAHAATLAMAVSNLVDNAVKYVEGDAVPRVRIRSEERRTTIRLWVEDEGIGIAPEHHDRIYRVFERLHGHEAYEGTGVGLASVRKGVERMGGTTGVESAPGQGSRFWIELPAWSES